MPRKRKGRKGLRRLARMYAVYGILGIMVLSAVPVMAVAPPGSMKIPEPEDWGVPAYLRTIQGREEAALGNTTVVTEANLVIDGITAYTTDREPAMGDFTLHDSKPYEPEKPKILDLESGSSNQSLPDVLQLVLDQPLKLMIYVESGEHGNWVETFLRPYFEVKWDGLVPRLVNWQRWEEVNVDNNTATGDAEGDDVRLRLAPVLETRDFNATLLPPSFFLQLRGGLSLEVERLGSGSEDLPIDVTFMKSFRYSGLNYTWFLELKLDHIPQQGHMSITADQVNISAETGKLRETVMAFLANRSLENLTRMGSFAGPYTIFHTASENMRSIHATLGYLKMAERSGEEQPVMEEASWVIARINPPSDAEVAPRTFTLWLDSPAPNRTFDKINWTADRPSFLEIEYFDGRGNVTQVRATIYDAPAVLSIDIGEKMEEVGRVARVHFKATSPIPRITFDQWDFIEGDRRKYLHVHVDLIGLPKELWMNGTMDVGGQPIEVLRPDPSVGSFIPQMLDTVMVTLTSKLFNIGRILRALPENILNMPDQAGYTTLQFPDHGVHLGMVEFWMTSRHYVTVEEGTDFFAFYNDTVEPEGRMIQTGFSGRMLDIRSFAAEFSDRKVISLESRYNREFRVLFIDEKNQANASIRFSNIPHSITLELKDDRMVYMGDGTVDRIQYTHEIGDQFLRMRIDGVPGGVDILLGDEVVGVKALIGAIDVIEIQLTDGPVRQMTGDHILAELHPGGTTAASLRISNLTLVMLDRSGEDDMVSIRTGGNPIKVLIDDSGNNFHLRAYLDPLPRNIDVKLTDMIGLSDIGIPDIQNTTSVLDFSSIIFAFAELADNVLLAVGDATANLIDGIGTFSSNLTLEFEGDTNMDLVATIQRTGDIPVPPTEWVHGLTSNMVPQGEDMVLIDAKIFITGISPKGTIMLRSSPESTTIDLKLEEFAPRYKELAILVNGASTIPDGGGKDIWLYMSDLVAPLDLELHLNINAETDIGGRTEGQVRLKSSAALGPLHMHARIRGDTIATIEVLLSSVPQEADLSFVYEKDIHLQSTLSQSLAFVFVKMSRSLNKHEAPVTAITLHNVPTLVSLAVESGEDYDMDNTDPMANLPTMTVGTNDPGLDVLVDIEGRSLGNQVDLFMDARNLKDISMARSGDEYRISAEQLEYIQIQIRNLAYTDTVLLDRIDVVATDLTLAVVKVDMVFGVFPLISVGDLSATGLQLGITGRMELMGNMKDISIVIFEVPMSLTSMPASHSNGVAMTAMEGRHVMFVPAPMGTVMGTLLG